MPVIECSALESRAINSELFAGTLHRLAWEERCRNAPQTVMGHTLPELLALGRDLYYAADTKRKRWILTEVVCSRALFDGSRASFPEVLYWLRDPGKLGAKTQQDPLADLCLLAWGDVWEEIGDGRVRLRMPYDPLPHYVDPADADLDAKRAARVAREARRLAPDLS